MKKEEENNRSILRPITDWCTHKAVFYDENGAFVGVKKLKYSERTFKFKEGAYNFLPEESGFFKVRNVFRTIKYYQYIIGEPQPLKIGKKTEPIINAEVYRRVLESDLVKKLAPKKNNLFDMIGGWKGLIVILIAIGIIYYIANGGSLSGTGK